MSNISSVRFIWSINANGGSGPSSQEKTTSGPVSQPAVASIPTVSMSRTGYTFSGWSGNSTLTTTYPTIPNSTSKCTGSVTAIWKEKTYTITYNANGGSNAPAAQTKKYTKDLILTTDQPTRAGCVFIGWATSKSGVVTYASGATFTTNANTTLYAVWVEATYKITFNKGSEHATGTMPTTQTVNYNSTINLPSTLPSMNRDNYNFAGTWHTSQSTSATTLLVTKNETIYANWTPTVSKLENPKITVSPTLQVDKYTHLNLTIEPLVDSTNLSCYTVTVGASTIVYPSSTSQTTLQLADFTGLNYGQTYSLSVSASNKIPGDDKEFNGVTTISNLVTTSNYAAPNISVYSDADHQKIQTQTRIKSTGTTLYFQIPLTIGDERIYYTRCTTDTTPIWTNVQGPTYLSATIDSITPNIYFRRGGLNE